MEISQEITEELNKSIKRFIFTEHPKISAEVIEYLSEISAKYEAKKNEIKVGDWYMDRTGKTILHAQREGEAKAANSMGCKRLTGKLQTMLDSFAVEGKCN